MVWHVEETSHSPAPAWGGAQGKGRVADVADEERLRAFPKLGAEPGGGRGGRAQRDRSESGRDYESRREPEQSSRDSERYREDRREGDRYRDERSRRDDGDRNRDSERRDNRRDDRRYRDERSRRDDGERYREPYRDRRDNGLDDKDDLERPVPVIPDEGPWTAYVGNLPYHDLDERDIGNFFEDAGCKVFSFTSFVLYVCAHRSASG